MSTLKIQYYGIQPYNIMWELMRAKNKENPWSGDTIIFAEHPSVYTLGALGGREHLRAPTSIDIIPTDRGGSITYHGPGQLMIYPLMDMRPYASSIKKWMDTLEHSIISWLEPYIPHLHTIADRRGIYSNNKKLVSMGLRIANGRSYHGLCVNMDCDLTPFDNINPCGYADLMMTQWSTYSTVPDNWHLALENALCKSFNYTSIIREVQHVRVTPDCKITWPR